MIQDNTPSPAAQHPLVVALMAAISRDPLWRTVILTVAGWCLIYQWFVRPLTDWLLANIYRLSAAPLPSMAEHMWQVITVFLAAIAAKLVDDKVPSPKREDPP